MVIVRQATLEDRSAIFEFHKEAYPQIWRSRSPERWDWEFANNPFRIPGSLPVWIAVDEEKGKVVGQVCALMEPLWMGGQRCLISWGVDYYVLKEYRGMSLGKQLYGAMLAHVPTSLTLSMSESARIVMLKLGMQPLPFVPLFTRILRHEPHSVLNTLASKMPGGRGRRAAFWQKSLGILQIHRLAAAALTLRERWRDRGLAGQMDPELEFVQAAAFGPEVNVLWERLKNRYNGLVVRDMDFLNWKFTQQPFMEHTLWLAYRKGQLEGYVILRRGTPPENNVGMIADLFADPEDEALVRSLVGHALRQFWQNGTAYVEGASSVPLFQRVYPSFLFKITNQRKPVILSKDSFPEDGWLFSRGDHDWDQYPLG